MYERGDGFPQNIFFAADWYRKAADQGHLEALKRLQGLNLPDMRRR